MAYQSRLVLDLKGEVFDRLRDRLAEGIEELAEAGETLTGDELLELAEKVRAIDLSAS